MLALKITDIKDFTNKLFIGEVFDRFRLSEAVITTFAVLQLTEPYSRIFLIQTRRRFWFRSTAPMPFGRT
jgi:hypothetical protein